MYSQISWLQFEKEPWLWSEDDQKILLYWLGVIQRDLKVAKDVSQCHTLLVQSKLLTYAIPEGEK